MISLLHIVDKTCVLQLNLFLAVLKTKFGKAQTLFQDRIQVSGEERKNTLMRFFKTATTGLSTFAANKRNAADAKWSRAASKFSEQATGQMPTGNTQLLGSEDGHRDSVEYVSTASLVNFNYLVVIIMNKFNYLIFYAVV